MNFKDHFSGHSDDYARFRPTYPIELVEYLAEIARRRELVWEAGCGSGQFSRLLAERFGRVIATDASKEQLAMAPRLANVEYRLARAEESGLPPQSADLCVAAQAAHWFDLDAYYSEVRRVGRPGSVLALITYALMSVNEPIDDIVREFYDAELDRYWPPERKLVEALYATMPFPFDELEPPAFEMREDWTLDEFLGYIGTWSGVRAMIDEVGPGAFEAFSKQIAAAWGSGMKTVRWPLGTRVGRLEP